ncbi:G8 domain-containing protein [Deinococcus misasensis]|uniref:G8 domain-containing protein n=1 Tax=Deinococcus misasensis TaxID=392413 RepID=UPI00054F7149|nr:G8 domain-containing protein [Deinococcus misasensis]
MKKHFALSFLTLCLMACNSGPVSQPEHHDHSQMDMANVEMAEQAVAPVTVGITGQWTGTLNGFVQFTNTTGQSVSSFKLRVKLSGVTRISNSWNGTVTGPDAQGYYTVTSPTYMGTLANGQAYKVEFSADGTGLVLQDAQVISPAPVVTTEALWSQASTWGGTVPAAGSNVTIPAGKTVYLDSNIDLNSLTINGTLICKDKDLSIRAGYIMIHGGRLQCGTATQPFTRKLTLTLKARPADENIMGMGTQFIGIMGGGTLDLHGIPQAAWVRLAQSAAAGSNTITLDQAVNWKVGDQIVVTSGDYDPLHAEERTIQAISGSTITLSQPLTYGHAIGQRSFDGMTVKKQVEVGLLTRNIVVQGQVSTVTFSGHTVSSKMGGHIMNGHGDVPDGGTLRLANVELKNLGQEGKLGRYPVHWHKLSSAAGQYIKNSSIHHSFNRCVTVHATNNVLVDGNFCHDTIGHAYFLEDGNEEGNTFANNLGAVVRRPNVQNTVERDKARILGKVYDADADSDIGARGNEPTGPTTYWIANGNNKFIGNVSAGSEGSGFWFTPQDRTDYIRAGDFDRNISHSEKGFTLVVTNKQGGIVTTDTPSTFSNYTFYNTNARGIWAHSNRMNFSGVRAADNVRAIFFSFDSYMKDSLMIGRSGIGPDDTRPHIAYTLYDGAGMLENVSFTGFRAGDVLFPTQGAATRRMNHRLSAINIDASVPVNTYFNGTWTQSRALDDNGVISSFIDTNKYFAQRAGIAQDATKPTYVVSNLPIMKNGNCKDTSLWPDVSICQNTYAKLKISSGAVDRYASVRRNDGATQRFISADPGLPAWQLPIILNNNYTYTFTSESPMIKPFTVDPTEIPAGQGVTLAFANLTGTPSAGTRLDSPEKVQNSTSTAYFQSGTTLYLKIVGDQSVKIN